jgi:ketosteroid isomerase-like protein
MPTARPATIGSIAGTTTRRTTQTRSHRTLEVDIVSLEEPVIVETYGDYFRAFQSLEVDRVLPYYHLPCLFVSPLGVSLVIAAQDGQALLGGMMKGLAARGYAWSEWADLVVKRLSDDLALLSTRVRRLKADGQALETFGATYTFRKTEGGWKIVVLLVHDAMPSAPDARSGGDPVGWRPAAELGARPESR